MKSIKINQLKPEYNIIDIRKKEKYIKSHIYNARNINEDILINMPQLYMNKDEIYYIYCSTGLHSKRCCRLLEIQGYNVINVEDGYENKV